MSGVTLPDRRRVLLFTSAGGAKPIAATEMDAGCLAAAWGWVGGVYPSAQIQGADSGFRRTANLHPRRAKRRAQVCGDSTVKSDGRWAGSPHPPQAVPLPLKGKDKKALGKGSVSSLIERLY